MKKTMSFTLFLLVVAYPIYGMSVKTIVDEMNARYTKIVEMAGGIKITQVIKSISNGAEVSSVQNILKKGKRYRIETISQLQLDEEKTKNVILFDGANIWFISPYVGITMMPKDEAMIHGVFDDFSKLIPLSSRISGEEKINNEDCYIIKTPDDSDVPFKKIWVSQTRFVPLKVTGMLSNKIITLIFTDYKKIEGIWGIPNKTETMIDNEVVATSTVETVETDIDIANETFDIQSQ